MKSSFDFVYWCLKNTSYYYGPRDLLIVPSAEIGEQQTYQRIVGCADQAGVEIPSSYRDLLQACLEEGLLIKPSIAMRTRGAVMFHKGAVVVCVGDMRRIVYEEKFRLTMKFVDPTQDVDSIFEYAARLPGMEYM